MKSKIKKIKVIEEGVRGNQFFHVDAVNICTVVSESKKEVSIYKSINADYYYLHVCNLTNSRFTCGRKITTRHTQEITYDLDKLDHQVIMNKYSHILTNSF